MWKQCQGTEISFPVLLLKPLCAMAKPYNDVICWLSVSPLWHNFFGTYFGMAGTPEQHDTVRQSHDQYKCQVSYK
ncbi:hypothetical protein V1504DRAFT_450600 [Lipomyces starkeyi]